MLGRGVDIVFCNEAEALTFTRASTLEDASRALKLWRKPSRSPVAPRGAWVFDGESLQLIASPAVKAPRYKWGGRYVRGERFCTA